LQAEAGFSGCTGAGGLAGFGLRTQPMSGRVACWSGDGG